jgi:hypothetical protein
MLKRILKYCVVLAVLNAPLARATELLALLSYDGTVNMQTEANVSPSGNGLGGMLLGHFELGPGTLETGLIYSNTPYWTIPLLYRVMILPPFVTLAFGPDYAISGTSSYKSNLGLEAGAQAIQELGNDFGAVLDLRYRLGLGDAISTNNTSVHYSGYLISLGIQKRFE